jgi:hypothetical protein
MIDQPDRPEPLSPEALVEMASGESPNRVLEYLSALDDDELGFVTHLLSTAREGWATKPAMCTFLDELLCLAAQAAVVRQMGANAEIASLEHLIAPDE